MKRAFAVTAVIIFAATAYWYLGVRWSATVSEARGLFNSESDAAYDGSVLIKASPPIAVVKRGETVTVLWDTYGKDYWVCYIRTSSGAYGWLLCTSLQKRDA